MPPSGNEWLALTTEPILEPELPICDPHHHFWVQRPEPADYQQYLLPDLAADINSGHNVRSTVFVEARSEYRTDGPEEYRPVGEVEFVQGIADESATGVYGEGRAAAAIIGRADLKMGDGVRPVLEALRAASPNRFRAGSGTRWVGIRIRTSRTGRSRACCSATTTWPGRGCLQDMGLILETSVYFPQLPELAEFARQVPDLTIVLNHIGGMMRTGPYANRDDEVIPQWRSGIDAVGAAPNIIMKLGGIGMPRIGFDWHTRETPVGSEEIADSVGDWMRHCLDQFGPESLHVREQLPGGQGVVLVPRDVQRLQAAVAGVLCLGARGGVPRHCGAGVPD